MVHGWSGHLVCAYISWMTHVCDFTYVESVSCQRMAGQMTFCARNGLKSLSPSSHAWNTSGKPIYSFMMVHGSHDTLSSLSLHKTQHYSLCLPPPHHSQLQPHWCGDFVYLSLFTQLDRKGDEIVEDTAEEMLREDFVKEYMDVRRTTFKLSTILRLAESGACQSDPSVFQDDTVLQVSHLTSASHVPATFHPSISYQEFTTMIQTWFWGNNEQDDLLLSSDSENSLESGDNETAVKWYSTGRLLRKPPS